MRSTAADFGGYARRIRFGWRIVIFGGRGAYVSVNRNGGVYGQIRPLSRHCHTHGRGRLRRRRRTGQDGQIHHHQAVYGEAGGRRHRKQRRARTRRRRDTAVRRRENHHDDSAQVRAGGCGEGGFSGQSCRQHEAHRLRGLHGERSSRRRGGRQRTHGAHSVVRRRDAFFRGGGARHGQSHTRTQHGCARRHHGRVVHGYSARGVRTCRGARHRGTEAYREAFCHSAQHRGSGVRAGVRA